MKEAEKKLKLINDKERPSLESLKKYVRVRSLPGAKFVEFDFAINDPSIFVELVMPEKEFSIFCRHHQVEFMSERQIELVDQESKKWRYGEETLMSSNREKQNNQ